MVTAVEPAHPSVEIIRHARARDGSAAHGHAWTLGFAPVMIGSIAEAVARGAACDVLLARAAARDFRLP